MRVDPLANVYVGRVIEKDEPRADLVAEVSDGSRTSWTAVKGCLRM